MVRNQVSRSYRTLSHSILSLTSWLQPGHAFRPQVNRIAIGKWSESSNSSQEAILSPSQRLDRVLELQVLETRPAPVPRKRLWIRGCYRS